MPLTHCLIIDHKWHPTNTQMMSSRLNRGVNTVPSIVINIRHIELFNVKCTFPKAYSCVHCHYALWTPYNIFCKYLLCFNCLMTVKFGKAGHGNVGIDFFFKISLKDYFDIISFLIVQVMAILPHYAIDGHFREKFAQMRYKCRKHIWIFLMYINSTQTLR